VVVERAGAEERLSSSASSADQIVPAAASVAISRTMPLTSSHRPSSRARTTIAPNGWRIRITPAIALTMPTIATRPRSTGASTNEMTISRMPSTSRKTPVITASVARLIDGLASTITPTTTPSSPTRTKIHHALAAARRSIPMLALIPILAP
jgi:hypothetical protein